MGEQADDPFLQAWEAHETSPSPVTADDPWGSSDTQRVAGPGKVYSESSPLNNHHHDHVFQSCNNPSAISNNVNNNSNTIAGRDEDDCFEDDFGAWSETDVIFKSGLLDEKFKTVSVTAEEDDLWSSADLSSLNPLSLSMVVSEDGGPGESDDSPNARQAFQKFDVKDPSRAALKTNGPIESAHMKNNGNIVTMIQEDDVEMCDPQNSKMAGVAPNYQGDDAPVIVVQNDKQTIAVESDMHSGNNRETNVTAHPGSLSTAVAPKTVNSGQIGYGSIQDITRAGGNTSINLTPSTAVSSGDSTVLSANTKSGINDNHPRNIIERSAVLNSEASPDTGPNIPCVDIGSGTLREGQHQGSIMGNILDSDKEEKETMEGEEGITKDQSEQTPSGEANGETPVIDMKETIILNEDGTEVLINGENGEQDPNESLDTQTQTWEEEFPPDDVPPVQDPSIGGGMGDLPGKEPDLVNGDLEAEDQEEEQREITTEASEEEAIVNGQEDVPSEEHAIPDKPLGIQENGTDEKTGTKDEEIPSPREQELSAPINEETGLRSTVSREPGESYVKSAVKLREKKGSKVNSHVVKQNRISFVEQEVLRAKQKEEEFKREREMRSQELQHHGKASVPPPTGNSRLQSPTSPEPQVVKPAPTKPTPAKPVNRPSNSKAKAVYQELNYNPKTGGGNRSTAMVRDWESKFKK